MKKQLLVALVFSMPILAMNHQQLLELKNNIQSASTLKLQNDKEGLEWQLAHGNIEEVKGEQKVHLALIEQELAERRKKKIEIKKDVKKLEQLKKME